MNKKPIPRKRVRQLTEEQFAKHREYQRRWREKNKERSNEIAKKAQKKYCDNNKDKVREQRRTTRQRRRLKALEFFDSKCARCGFNDHRALQIDHINGRGRYDQYFPTVGGSRSLLPFIRLIEESPDLVRERYQCLCANCNWIKRYDNKEHWTH